MLWPPSSSFKNPFCLPLCHSYHRYNSHPDCPELQSAFCIQGQFIWAHIPFIQVTVVCVILSCWCLYKVLSSKYSCQTILYEFQVYNIMIQYLCTLQSDHHNKSSHPLSPKLQFFLEMAMFKVCFFSNFQMCNIVLLTIVATLYTISPWQYLMNDSLYLLILFIH